MTGTKTGKRKLRCNVSYTEDYVHLTEKQMNSVALFFTSWKIVQRERQIKMKQSQSVNTMHCGIQEKLQCQTYGFHIQFQFKPGFQTSSQF